LAEYYLLRKGGKGKKVPSRCAKCGQAIKSIGKGHAILLIMIMSITMLMCKHVPMLRYADLKH
jgi:hypothetical protein